MKLSTSSTRAAIRPEVKRTFYLAAPLILAQLAQISMSFIDTVMVGRLGNQALAAIALGSSIFMMVLIICMGTLFSVGPIVAQAYGRQDRETMARATRQGMWLAALLSLPAVLIFRNISPLLLWMGQDADIVPLSAAYLRAISWGFLPSLCLIALRGLLEGMGHPRPIMFISFAGVGLNIVANYTLIFGHFGFPALGLVGTGYATSFVYSSMFAMAALFVRRSLPDYRIFAGLRRPDFSSLRELVRIGIPIGMTLGFEAGLFTVTALLMGLLGTVELAGHQIAIQTASFTFMVPVGLATATSIRVGQVTGQGDIQAARLAGFVGIALSVLVMLASATAFWLIPRQIASLYLDIHAAENQAVVAQAVMFLGFAAMFQVFDGIQVSASGALRGLKDTRVPMLLSLFSYWFIGMSSGVVFTFVVGLGGRGLWMGLLLGLGSAALLLFRRFARLTSAQRRTQQAFAVASD